MKNITNIWINPMLIILPFFLSLSLFLGALNLAIWIYDDTKSSQAIKKAGRFLAMGHFFLV